MALRLLTPPIIDVPGNRRERVRRYALYPGIVQNDDRTLEQQHAWELLAP
ncbi:MAG: hypothetical protein M3380_02630 [Chloroflexota bacterium]|nr:hypothetical protein [Chloroflexota bacterium]